MPPRMLRRPVTITVWLIVSVVVLAISPLLLAIAELVAALRRDRRAPLVTRVVMAYFARELTTLAGCGMVWLLAGCGLLMRRPRIQELHWRLLRWFVGGIARSALETLDIKVLESSGSEQADAALRSEGPLLVLARHAGPGDTVLVIDRLLSHFGRRPSVVFKETLALDPSVDLIAHRLPHAVLDTDDRAECERRIARTAAVLGDRGALLIFPEGGNFTPERRRGALRSLMRRGERAAAEAGKRMEHVLPPRPLGTLSALAANPDADVIFAAHTGLGVAAYPREIWRNLPVGRTFRTRMWLARRAEIPTDEDGVAAWLNGWWSHIDDWIDACGQEE